MNILQEKLIILLRHFIQWSLNHILQIFFCVGTSLFLICTNFHDSKSKYTLWDYIDDTFAPIEQPMYSATMKCNSRNVWNINAKVYHSPNHTNILHMYIEHIIDKMSNKIRYNIKIKNLQSL